MSQLSTRELAYISNGQRRYDDRRTLPAVGWHRAANIPNTGDNNYNFSAAVPSTPAIYIIGDANDQHGFIKSYTQAAALDAFTQACPV